MLPTLEVTGSYHEEGVAAVWRAAAMEGGLSEEDAQRRYAKVLERLERRIDRFLERRARVGAVDKEE